MNKNYAWASIAFFCFVFCIISCSKSDDDYVPVEQIDDTPPDPEVTVDLTQVPYEKLSDYHFFDGDMKQQEPADGVLPYKPSSNLFADYAHKRRFVWMPSGTKATYASDDTVLELPVGAALIKTFYYDNVQNAPVPGDTRIVETRVMIRKADGWIFAEYVWNAEQTEAYLDMNGSDTPIEWIDDDGTAKTVNYHLPNEVQCIVCHKSQDTQGGTGAVAHLPIGIKPQNLNFNYDYGSEVKNQLTKWIEYGYLEGNFSLPSAANTVVNYEDATQTIGDRARAYFDANCSHCHMVNRHCDYRPMRFAWQETIGPDGDTNMGACVPTQDMQGLPANLALIANPGRPNNSMLFYRLNTTDETYRMPLHGRTMIHTEGVQLVRDWIFSLNDCD